jgi:hypothetical protein
MALPRIVEILRAGAPLDDLKAAAAKLWLDYGGADLDADGSLRVAVDTYWQGRPGANPYWDFLGRRGTCASCGEVYKYENLAICPDCFSTYCYRHARQCRCGHTAVG